MIAVQCKMARAAVGLGVRELADLAKVSPDTIARLERGDPLKERTVEAVQRALESAGVIFVQENGDGPGVRLRKTGAAGHAHALEHAEAAADRHLAQVDAPPEEKARRKRIVTRLAKDLATGSRKR